MRATISLFAVLLLLSAASDAQTVSSEGVPGAAFGPGAKVFLEPMDGLGAFLADAVAKKKVPVVLVDERAKADFVASGDAHVKKPGWFKGMVLTTHGKGNVAIRDARTGNEVFACNFRKVDQMVTEAQSYQSWADACAKRLKKTMEEK